MKKKAQILLLAVAAAVIVAGGLVHAADTETLTGRYDWDQGNSSGSLEAVFTPTGENTWDVAFHFEWQDRARTFSGTAEGSLTDGELKGTVYDERKRRTWKFSGEFTDGVFNGQHEELEDDRQFDTGTLTLSR